MNRLTSSDYARDAAFCSCEYEGTCDIHGVPSKALLLHAAEEELKIAETLYLEFEQRVRQARTARNAARQAFQDACRHSEVYPLYDGGAGIEVPNCRTCGKSWPPNQEGI